MAGSGCDPDDISAMQILEAKVVMTFFIIWTLVFILQRIKSELSCAEANSLLLLQGGRSNGVCSPDPSK